MLGDVGGGEVGRVPCRAGDGDRAVGVDAGRSSRARLRTISPRSVRSRRSFLRVAISSPTLGRTGRLWAGRRGRVRRRGCGRWQRSLSRSTASLVGAISNVCLAGLSVRHQLRRRRVPSRRRCRRGGGRGCRRSRRRDVASAELEAGVSFPLVFEAVDGVELDRAERVDQETEHAASADGGELERVADEGEAPALQVGEVGQLGELVGRHHAGFVDDHRRPTGRSYGDRAAAEAVLDEQLVERVGRHAGLAGEDVGGGRRRGDAEHGRPSARSCSTAG